MSFRATYRTSKELILITDFINDEKLPEAAGGRTLLSFYWKKTGQKRHCFESVSIFQLIHHLKSASESKQSWLFSFYFCVARLALFTNLGCSKFNLKPRFGSKKQTKMASCWHFVTAVLRWFLAVKLAELYQISRLRSVCKPF